MFKKLIISLLVYSFSLIYTFSANAVEVDLINETILGKPTASKLSVYIEKYGNPDYNNDNYQVYFNKSQGFDLYINTKTGLVNTFAAYFDDYNPANPSKVPKGNSSFKGEASFGIRKGATFDKVFKALKEEFPGRASITVGSKIVYYGDAPSNYEMKAIFLQLKQGAAYIGFDENDVVSVLHIDLDRDYWDRLGASYGLGNFLVWHN